MFEELLKVIKEGGTLNKDQINAFQNLSKKEKEKILKASEKRRETELNEMINREFRRVYQKLLVTDPEVANGLLGSGAKITGLAEEKPESDDGKFLDTYKDDRNYALNEVMIAVIRDDETPEDIRAKVREKIYTKNIGLIGSQLRRFSNKNDGKMTMEDLGQECRIVFFQKAVDKFDLSRGAKFSTFATTVVHNYLAGIYTNKINKQRALEVSFETPIVDDSGSVKTLLDYQIDPNPTAADIIRRESEKEIIIEQLNKLNLEQKFVAYCRYGLGGVPKKTQAEIADYMHMSQANVSKIEGTMRVKLKALLDEAGMF